MEATTLHKFLYDVPLGDTASKAKEIISNILEIYNKPFDPDIVYELFENCYDALNQLKLRKLPNATFYSVDGGEVFIPYPKNIEKFLWDCESIWKIKLEWEKNLVRSKFKLSL